MKTFSAIFSTDAWDEENDTMIVEFEAMPECNAEDLLHLAKIAFAKDIYASGAKPPQFSEEMDQEKLIQKEAEEEKKLLHELESDCFYVKCVAIFEGRTKINKSGIEVCK